VVDWLDENAQAGDLLLIGGRDWISRVIQRITESPYSHVSVVIGSDLLIEAYDYNLTISEEDEGVYETSFTTFAKRHKEISEIALYRLPGQSFDIEKMRYAAALMSSSAPTYPTLAAFVFLAGHLAGRVARAKRRKRLLGPSQKGIRAQARFWGDGPRRVHCAELATRLYCASGAELDFHEPFLSLYIDSVNGKGNYRAHRLQALDAPRRMEGLGSAEKVRSTESLGSTARGFSPLGRTAEIFNAIVNRALCEAEPDIADYIMPDDFTKAAPFERVGSLIVDSRAV